MIGTIELDMDDAPFSMPSYSRILEFQRLPPGL